MKKFNLDKIRNSKFDFAGNLKYFIIAPLVIIAIGIVLLCTVGFNKGIDFTGGTIINVILGDSLQNTQYYNDSVEKVKDVFAEKGLSISIVQLSETEQGESLLIRYQDKAGLNEEEMNTLNTELKTALLEEFNFDPDDPEQSSKIQDGQRIGATASSELLTNAFIAILVVVAAILIYIAFRFEFTSGMAAILALAHDILVMSSVMLIFRIEIDSSFIAALITIIGYSINNTILIFDKVRENLKSALYEKASNRVIANQSVKDNLKKSIYTAFTTLLTILMVAILGTYSIRIFAIAIIIGLVAGTYSSIFIAPGLWSIAYVRKKATKISDKNN